jgi:hypothetical protein
LAFRCFAAARKQNELSCWFFGAAPKQQNYETTKQQNAKNNKTARQNDIAVISHHMYLIVSV